MSEITVDRAFVDSILSQYCEKLGLVYTDIHDEAFCFKVEESEWLYIWYGFEDELVLSEIVAQFEKLLHDYKQLHDSC